MLYKRLEEQRTKVSGSNPSTAYHEAGASGGLPRIETKIF
jgi:hypothetical protein